MYSLQHLMFLSPVFKTCNTLNYMASMATKTNKIVCRLSRLDTTSIINSRISLESSNMKANDTFKIWCWTFVALK
jgi:hypothetical protein